MLEGLKAKLKTLFNLNNDQKKAEEVKAAKGQNKSAVKTMKSKAAPVFDANLEDELNQGLRVEHKKKEEYEPDEKGVNLVKSAKNPLLDKLDKQQEALEKTRSEQGLIGKAWDWFKNNTRLGKKRLAGSNKAENQIKAERELVQKLLSGEKVDAKKFEEITGLEYTTDNISKFKNGEAELLSTAKLKDYQEGQEMVLDVTADVVAGLSAGIGVVAAPFTGGASLLLAVGIGAALKTGIKYVDAKVGGREYKTFAKDIVTGGATGLLTPITAGAGGVVANVITRTVGKNLVGRGVAFVGEQAVAGAIFGGGAETVNEAYDQIQNREFDGAKILSKTVEGAEGGAIGGVLFGGAFKGAGKMFKIFKTPFKNIGEFFNFNKKPKALTPHEESLAISPKQKVQEGNPFSKKNSAQNAVNETAQKSNIPRSKEYTNIENMIDKANSREDFAKIRDELKRLPLGKERDALIRANREKYQVWSQNSPGRNVVNQYNPNGEILPAASRIKLSNNSIEILKKAFQKEGINGQQVFENTHELNSIINSAEKWYGFKIDEIIDDAEVVNSIISAYKIKNTNVEEMILYHTVSDGNKSYNLFDGFDLSSFEINQLFAAIKKEHLNDIRRILQKNNPEMYGKLNIKGFYDSDKFSSHINDLGKKLPAVKYKSSQKTCNIGNVNGKKLLIDCSSDNVKSRIEKGAFYETKGKTNVYNTRTLLTSNLITDDAIVALKQNGIDIISQEQGSRFSIIGEKIKFNIGKIVKKYDDYGIDSLTSREIHALTDYLENLYDKNNNFKIILDNIVKNNKSINRLRASLAAIRKELDAKLSNSNLIADDHFIGRIVDRNHLNILNISNDKFRTEFIQAIEKNSLVKELRNGSQCEFPITVDNKHYVVKVQKEGNNYRLITII